MWRLTRPRLPAAGWWILAGTLVSTGGSAMQTLAAGKYLYDQTGSAAAFGAVMVFQQVLAVMTQFVAGPWVDRHDQRRTLVCVELFRGSALVAISALLVTWHGDLLAIVLMSSAITVAQPFYRASLFAITPSVVGADALASFNAATNVVIQAGYLAGVVGAGVVLGLWSPALAFALNGASYLFSALTLIRARGPRPSNPQQPERVEPHRRIAVLAGWREFIDVLRHDAGLAWHLVISTADNLAVLLFNLLLFALVAERFAGGAGWLAALDGVFTIGALVTTAAVTTVSTRYGARRVVVAGIGGQAVAFVLLAVASSGGATLALTLVLGACNTLSWTVVTTRLQLRAHAGTAARISTARSLASALIGAACVPVVSTMASTSLAWALVASGGLCLLFSATSAVLARTRSLGRALFGEEFDGGALPVAGAAK